MHSSENGTDRRRFRRINADYLTDYRLLEEEDFREGKLFDVSCEGIRFQCRRPFLPGQKLGLKVWLPDEASFISFSGIVVWSDSIGPYDEHLFDVGISIFEISTEERRKLDGLLKNSETAGESEEWLSDSERNYLSGR